MLVSRFRTYRPAVLLVVFVLVPLFWAPSFFAPRADIVPAPMFFYAPLADLFTAVPWATWIIGVLFTLILAFQVDTMANSVELYERRNHLPALLFPIVMSMVPSGSTMSPALLGMPLILLALRRAWRIPDKPKVLGTLFDSGLLIGLAALFYLPYAFLIVVVMASVAVMRSFSWREFVAPVLALAVVIFLAWGISRLFELEPWRTGQSLTREPLGTLTRMPKQLVWAALGVAALLLPYSLIAFAAVYQRSIMREKNLRASLLAFFAASIPIMAMEFLLNGNVPAVVLATPIALFLTYPFHAMRRLWLAELAVLTMLGIGLAMQWTA